MIRLKVLNNLKRSLSLYITKRQCRHDQYQTAWKLVENRLLTKRDNINRKANVLFSRDKLKVWGKDFYIEMTIRE